MLVQWRASSQRLVVMSSPSSGRDRRRVPLTPRRSGTGSLGCRNLIQCSHSANLDDIVCGARNVHSVRLTRRDATQTAPLSEEVGRAAIRDVLPSELPGNDVDALWAAARQSLCGDSPARVAGCGRRNRPWPRLATFREFKKGCPQWSRLLQLLWQPNQPLRYAGSVAVRAPVATVAIANALATDPPADAVGVPHASAL